MHLIYHSFSSEFWEHSENVLRIFWEFLREYSENVLRKSQNFWECSQFSECSQNVLRIFSEHSENILGFWERSQNILRTFSEWNENFHWAEKTTSLFLSKYFYFFRFFYFFSFFFLCILCIIFFSAVCIFIQIIQQFNKMLLHQ